MLIFAVSSPAAAALSLTHDCGAALFGALGVVIAVATSFGAVFGHHFCVRCVSTEFLVFGAVLHQIDAFGSLWNGNGSNFGFFGLDFLGDGSFGFGVGAFAARFRALMFHENSVEVVVAKGLHRGAVIELIPALSCQTKSACRGAIFDHHGGKFLQTTFLDILFAVYDAG